LVELFIWNVWLGFFGAEVSEWAMLVPVCIVLSLLFIDSCGEKTKRYVLSHPHRGLFNMDACWRVMKIGYLTSKQA
jgi:hypothetical protein